MEKTGKTIVFAVFLFIGVLKSQINYHAEFLLENKAALNLKQEIIYNKKNVYLNVSNKQITSGIIPNLGLNVCRSASNSFLSLGVIYERINFKNTLFIKLGQEEKSAKINFSSNLNSFRVPINYGLKIFESDTIQKKRKFTHKLYFTLGLHTSIALQHTKNVYTTQYVRVDDSTEFIFSENFAFNPLFPVTIYSSAGFHYQINRNGKNFCNFSFYFNFKRRVAGAYYYQRTIAIRGDQVDDININLFGTGEGLYFRISKDIVFRKESRFK